MAKLITNPQKPSGIRAVGILIKNERILLIKRESGGKKYFTFPGGGVEEEDINVENAVKRELLEETGADVDVIKLRYRMDIVNDSDHLFYEVKCDGEVPLVMTGEELIQNAKGNKHTPVWFSINKIKEITLYPLEVRDWLINDTKNGWESEVRLWVGTIDEIRQ